jgi:hypothetical protein
MLLIPLQDVRERSSWELVSDNAISNADGDFIISIDGMKMGWIMIPIQDGDGNRKEATSGSKPRRCLVFSRSTNDKPLTSA